jgi:hypothetical protein
MRNVAIAAAFGILFTLLLLAFALAAFAAGHDDIARVLSWPNGLLQSVVGLNNIGTPEHPVYEGTPLNFLAFVASIPLGFVVYGACAYLTVRLLQRRQ